MIRDKSISKAQNVIIDFEEYQPDEGPIDSRSKSKGANESLICVIPSKMSGLKGQHLAEKANSLLLDEVVCISGSVDTDGRWA